MKYNPIKKHKTTVIEAAKYIAHFCSKPPKNVDIKKAVATYLAISINHFPTSFSISKKFCCKDTTFFNSQKKRIFDFFYFFRYAFGLYFPRFRSATLFCRKCTAFSWHRHRQSQLTIADAKIIHFFQFSIISGIKGCQKFPGSLLHYKSSTVTSNAPAVRETWFLPASTAPEAGN